MFFRCPTFAATIARTTSGGTLLPAQRP
jgi:hypothetical protein